MPTERAFPEGFLWGSAGCAHQTEGGNMNSDWWEHEQTPGTSAAEPSGRACDSYTRFAEDWRLVAHSGQNAVRFSIEWARIEPSPGEFSREALDHYREVIGTARDLGLRTCVTLHHFTSPLWFARRGGWESEESVAAFSRYTEAATAALGDLFEDVCTINEPSVVAIVGNLMGYFPPRKTDLGACHRVSVNLLRAHAAAAAHVRSSSNARAGVALSVLDFRPADRSGKARRSRDYLHHWWVGMWLEALRSGRVRGLEVPDTEVPGLGGSDEFVGVQYYTALVPGIGAEGNAKAKLPGPSTPRGVETGMPEGPMTQMSWVWHPAGLGLVLDEVASVTGLPVMVTENGIATADDAERIEYVRLHLEQVHDAIARGVDVRGYFYWSTLDNFEWNEGYRPAFGLIAVDRQTMERTPKPSLAWYGSVARANALDA